MVQNLKVSTSYGEVEISAVLISTTLMGELTGLYYAQNRLFYLTAGSSKPTILVDYCVIPEYDTLLANID